MDTVAVLIAATERVFAREGYDGTTTNRIAQVAGVSIGTLYHYFTTKEALIQAMVHDMWTQELEAVESHAAALADAPLEELVAGLVGALAEHVARRRELYRHWYAEAPHLGRLDVGLEITGRGVRFVEAALERHRARLRPTDLRFAADFVTKVVLAAVRTAARDYPRELASGELARELTAMITGYLVDPRGQGARSPGP